MNLVILYMLFAILDFIIFTSVVLLEEKHLSLGTLSCIIIISLIPIVNIIALIVYLIDVFDKGAVQSYLGRIIVIDLRKKENEKKQDTKASKST